MKKKTFTDVMREVLAEKPKATIYDMYMLFPDEAKGKVRSTYYRCGGNKLADRGDLIKSVFRYMDKNPTARISDVVKALPGHSYNSIAAYKRQWVITKRQVEEKIFEGITKVDYDAYKEFVRLWKPEYIGVGTNIRYILPKGKV